MLPGTKMDGKDFTEFTKNSRYEAVKNLVSLESESF